MFVLFYIQLFSYLLCKYVIKRSVQFRSDQMLQTTSCSAVIWGQSRRPSHSL